MDPISGISVVVPVYNSEKSLPVLVDRLYPVLTSLQTPYELILVNDGSRDDSWSVIMQLSTEQEWIVGINLMRNFGQHNALLCGIRSAKYSLTVTMDDDLQHPPEEIPKFIEKLNEGYDVVYGPTSQEQHNFWRDLASRMTKFGLGTVMGAETAQKASAFRLFRTQIRDSFADYQGPFVVLDVLLTWGTMRFTYVLVQHEPRQIGASNYTLRKLVSHAMNMITGFSTLPLQLASWLGFAFTFFGIAVLAYVIGRYIIEGGSVAGFPFLASTIAIFSGVQLFVIGIFGEYLARMYQRSMNRPTYAIRTTTASLNHQPQVDDKFMVDATDDHV